jgi:hypothetical protein
MRAHRFSLELPIRYRRVGELAWNDGTTRNISQSGVLFHGTAPIALESEIEISLSITTEAPLAAAADLVCTARIVRTHAWDGGAAALAAAFLNYRFEPLGDSGDENIRPV